MTALAPISPPSIYEPVAIDGRLNVIREGDYVHGAGHGGIITEIGDPDDEYRIRVWCRRGHAGPAGHAVTFSPAGVVRASNQTPAAHRG